MIKGMLVSKFMLLYKMRKKSLSPKHKGTIVLGVQLYLWRHKYIRGLASVMKNDWWWLVCWWRVGNSSLYDKLQQNPGKRLHQSLVFVCDLIWPMMTVFYSAIVRNGYSGILIPNNVNITWSDTAYVSHSTCIQTKIIVKYRSLS